MRRPRRFKVQRLDGATKDNTCLLDERERQHLKVLRLPPQTPLELFDGKGWQANALLIDGIGTCRLIEDPVRECISAGPVLGIAWPKGKRAATMVEKCCELGVQRIVPVHFKRSVVTKENDSSGMLRLRRIADDAAKQSGNPYPPEIEVRLDFESFVTSYPEGILLHPRASHSVLNLLEQSASCAFAIGPEGGITEEEQEMALQNGYRLGSLGKNVLRIETAALAACAIFAQWVLKGFEQNR